MSSNSVSRILPSQQLGDIKLFERLTFIFLTASSESEVTFTHTTRLSLDQRDVGITHRAKQPSEKTEMSSANGGGAHGSKESTKHLDAIVLKTWFWRKILGNFGEILLIGAKSG